MPDSAAYRVTGKNLYQIPIDAKFLLFSPTLLPGWEG
jgi:hypothetical protein